MLSSSARGSGEARGEPGGGPGATAVSGHRLSTTRTRRQTQFMSPQGQGFPRAGGREPGAFNPSLSAAGGAPGVSWAAGVTLEVRSVSLQILLSSGPGG